MSKRPAGSGRLPARTSSTAATRAGARPTRTPRKVVKAVGAAADLERMWLPPSRGKDPRVTLNGPIAIESGIAHRAAVPFNAASGLPGFRWDIPLPDPQRAVLWASLAFDWQFYEWKSLGHNLHNSTNKKIFVDGSLDWRWLLTGHPQVFPTAPVFLQGSGHFTFNTFISPGAEGFDVGWLAPPASATFSSTPDKTDASMTSPLQRLMAMKNGGVLKLWFAMDFQHIRYKLDNGNDRTGGYTIGGGPDTIYYAYAYGSPILGTVAEPPLLVMA